MVCIWLNITFLVWYWSCPGNSYILCMIVHCKLISPSLRLVMVTKNYLINFCIQYLWAIIIVPLSKALILSWFKRDCLRNKFMAPFFRVKVMETSSTSPSYVIRWSILQFLLSNSCKSRDKWHAKCLSYKHQQQRDH